jgi:hypothetical protein
LEILVVELLVAKFNLRHKVWGKLIFEHCNNFMCAADALRIAYSSRGADQKEPTMPRVFKISGDASSLARGS